MADKDSCLTLHGAAIQWIKSQLHVNLWDELHLINVNNTESPPKFDTLLAVWYPTY